jgi:hypothetical protein
MNGFTEHGVNEHGVGHEIGTEAAEYGEHHASEYCTRERQRIEFANQPKTFALRAKIATLQESEQDLKERIRKAAPPSEERERKRKMLFYWSIAALLSIAAFVFSVIAFDPFRLGWKAWLYCLGIAVVTPFLVEKILDSWASPRLVKILATVACVAAVTSLVLLAVIRGDLLAEQITNATPVVVLNGDAPASQAVSTFFDRTLGLLRIIMAFLALAIELGAGIALYEARRWSASGEDGVSLRRALASLRDEMIETGHALWLLENEGAIFENQFWRDFYRSLLNGAKRGAIQKLTLIVLCLALFTQGRLFAAERLDVVILLDMSQSVTAKDHANTEEFKKNVNSVTEVLVTLPAGSRVAVFGITGDSFSTPYPLLRGQLDDDEGYFKERLAKGHAELVRAWQQRSSGLTAQFPETDLLGAILVAAQVFDHPSVDRKKEVLMIFSDMRQSTSVLDFERSTLVQKTEALQQIAKSHLIPDLHGVAVYALGVDASGKSVNYWQTLRDFWIGYFELAGATVKSYSILRQIPR